MQRDFIVRDYGIRLLEVQIVTGGVIDFVYSYRVFVDVVYQRGYFDEDMNSILADFGDDIKGFFDFNIYENFIYLQLLRRCVRDLEIGFYMLQLVGKGFSVYYLSEELRRVLREVCVILGTGDFQGQSIFVWEFFFYREVFESLRQDLLRRYQVGGFIVYDVIIIFILLLVRVKDGSLREDL